jgi:hypothetical protein
MIKKDDLMVTSKTAERTAAGEDKIKHDNATGDSAAKQRPKADKPAQSSPVHRNLFDYLPAIWQESPEPPLPVVPDSEDFDSDYAFAESAKCAVRTVKPLAERTIPHEIVARLIKSQHPVASMQSQLIELARHQSLVDLHGIMDVLIQYQIKDVPRAYRIFKGVQPPPRPRKTPNSATKKNISNAADSIDKRISNASKFFHALDKGLEKTKLALSLLDNVLQHETRADILQTHRDNFADIIFTAVEALERLDERL